MVKMWRICNRSEFRFLFFRWGLGRHFVKERGHHRLTFFSFHLLWEEALDKGAKFELFENIA